jgi:hypothetical protein
VAQRLARRFRVVRLQRRQYRLDLTGSGCSIAAEVEDVLAVATEIGTPTLLVGHPSDALARIIATQADTRLDG